MIFGFIIRPFRSLYRALSRVSIEKREQQALSDTRKVLLTYRSACENSKAEVSKFRERVARLSAALLVEQARAPEKRSFDWARFDQNTLMTAIKDDLYEAEKKLHEELANLESNEANRNMFESRELRLVASLEHRTHMSEVRAPQVALDRPATSALADSDQGLKHVTNGTHLDNLTTSMPSGLGRTTADVEADVAAGRNPLRYPRSTPSEMGGMIAA